MTEGPRVEVKCAVRRAWEWPPGRAPRERGKRRVVAWMRRCPATRPLR
ncbi:MAG: hypothetical protein MZV70_00155 [Desulfobacterales bacterium]|nr:hypothetical protein [Desulfobacterales bacterium]